MKTTKRLIAMAAALTLTACAAAPVFTFADDPTTYTVTINQNDADKGTHTYEAYQIFSGDLSGTTLSNIQWGTGIKTADKEGLGDAADYAKTITNENASQTAKNLISHLDSGAKITSFDALEAGYYLFKDADASPTGTSGAKTLYILKVVANTSINIKSSVPTVVKKVQDINDSNASPSLSGLQDSADYDIGDEIPYTVTATIGERISDYSAYSLQFVDEMSDGLTLVEDSWDIKVGTKSIKTLFTAAKSPTGNTWTWATNDVMANTDVPITSETKVVLTYKVKLNSNAVIGLEGNPNTVKLMYDNNPYSCGEGNPQGQTPEDVNIVFTYKTVFNKVDESGNALTGADFKLEKKVNGSYVDVTELHTETGAINPIKTGNTSGSTFTFTGLDDGDYKLTEITTPSGYNTISPIEFTITAEHEIESDNPLLKSLSGTGGATFDVSVPNGELNTSIKNTTGSTLPTTGGTGTKVLYAIGGTILVGAGMVLVSKKRAQK